MNNTVNVANVIDKIFLDKVFQFFLSIYDTTLDCVSSEFDDSYCENAVLYRRTYNALPSFSELNSDFIFPPKANNKPILFLPSKNIYFRFLTKPLATWKREKDRYQKNVGELFSVSSNFNYSLFDDENVNTLNPFFAFIWCETSQTDSNEIYVRVKIVDDKWATISEYSSDEIHTLRPMEADFWSDLDEPVEIDVSEIEISSPTKEIEVIEPKIYSEGKEKANGTKLD